jgi:hypothetical protein
MPSKLLLGWFPPENKLVQQNLIAQANNGKGTLIHQGIQFKSSYDNKSREVA